MIDRIGQGDIEECVYVIRSSFKTVADEMAFTKEEAPRFTAFATTRERLEDQFLQGRPMFGYYDGNKIVGYYSLCLMENSQCELNNLCVLPEYRHEGIGGQILSHALNEAKEMGCVQMNLGIVEENVILRNWYKRHGAIHTETKKFDFFPFTCGYMKFIIKGNETR